MATVEELMADARVRKTTYKSLRSSIRDIIEYAVEQERPVKFMIDAYVRIISPYDKKHNPNIEETQQTLEKFWADIALIGCKKFDELEEYLLLTDTSVATSFPEELKEKAISIGKGPLFSRFIDPVLAARARGESYASLDELLEKQGNAIE